MTFIIAEVGSNWKALEDCYYAIESAMRTGADAVKFQIFDEIALYGYEGAKPDLKPYCLPKEWVPLLKAKADATNIEFMISAFSPDLFHYVDPYVRRHKIASSCCTDPTILAAVKATGKDTIISFGGCDIGEMKASLEKLNSNVTAMYCVPAYPAKWTDLRNIPYMREMLKVPIGYSDHSLDVINSPIMSVIHFGAVVLEKHFTALSPDISTPDSPHSLNEHEFRHMVDAIRWQSKVCLSTTPDDVDMIERHRNRPTKYGWKRICPLDQ